MKIYATVNVEVVRLDPELIEELLLLTSVEGTRRIREETGLHLRTSKQVYEEIQQGHVYDGVYVALDYLGPGETPRYEHDGCESCVFLGRYLEYDLYFCRQPNPDKTAELPTVMARWSDEPSEYLSGMPCPATVREAPYYATVVAMKMAIERGLYE